MKLSTAVANPAETSMVARHRALVAAEGPIWTRPSPSQQPTTDQVMHRRALVAPDVEQRFVEIMSRPLPPGTNHRVGGDEREREAVLFCRQLARAQALAIRQRLMSERADDPIVASFRRIAVERRARMLTVLATPRPTAR